MRCGGRSQTEWSPWRLGWGDQPPQARSLAAGDVAPVVDNLPGRVDTLVHGDISSGRRVVVEMADGIRLVPVGRLRHRPPKRMILNGHADVRVSLADSFILP